MKKLLLIATTLFACNAEAQIVKPAGYKNNVEQNQTPGSVQHISNGRYEFSIYPLARDMSSDDKEQSLKEGLEMTFHDTKYSKTSDGLYVGTGRNKAGLYYYNIYVPETWQEVSLTSKFDDKEFSANSLWILRQVRQHRKDIYFQ